MSTPVQPEAVHAFRASAEALARAGDVPAWLTERRRVGWSQFAATGFPTTRDEDWRFTSVAPITRTHFAHANGFGQADSLAALVEWLRFGARCALVFLNGRYAPKLSCPWPDDAVRLRPLSHVLLESPALVEPHLARLTGDGATPFAALNTALAEDGAVVTIAPGRVVATPISLVFVGTSRGAAGPVAAHPRVLVLAGRGSQATVVEAYGGPVDEAYFTNGVTEVVLDDGAILDHVRVQRESQAAFHVATLATRLGRASRYRAIALDLGASLARTDIGVTLAGEGAECELDGLFMAAAEQHTDTHTCIDHVQPHTSSREVYRGVLDGAARGVFHGRIVVRPGAQKTDAFQHNRNLVLSNTALVHSTPQLTIRADDVRCKHASTTGQIDPEALFYLRSRGIGAQAARSLLTYAFARDIVSRVAVPAVRRAIEALLRERLPGAPEELQ